METDKPAFLLVKPENQEEVNQVIEKEITRLINKEETPEKDFLVGSSQKIGKENLVIQKLYLSKFFNTYKAYDNFLLHLVQEKGFHSLENKALLIGHVDQDNHLWTDYSTKNFIGGDKYA